VSPAFSDVFFSSASAHWATPGALLEAPEAALAVFLLPARTDTRWWHEHALKATEIRFLRGRLKFGEAKNSAPFPSVLLIYRNETRPETRPETLKENR